MAEDLGLDERTQRVIWRALGTKSAKQIAEETGITPEDVLRIKNEMLEAVDVLTISQRRQKVMIQLETLANEAHEQATSAPAEFKAGLLNTAVAAHKELVRQLVVLQQEDDTKVTQLNELRVRELLHLVDDAVALSVKELSVRHGLDEDDMMAVFSENLRRTAERREISA